MKVRKIKGVKVVKRKLEPLDYIADALNVCNILLDKGYVCSYCGMKHSDTDEVRRARVLINRAFAKFTDLAVTVGQK